MQKFINADLHFLWKDCPFVHGDENPLYEYKDGEKRSWDKVRLDDYKFENFTKYFNIPKNVKIMNLVRQHMCLRRRWVE
jgi:hypothetical protein